MQTKKKKYQIKVGDNVKIISGSFKNMSGEVIKVQPKKETLIIKGINFKFKHQKPTKETEIGEIRQVEAPIHYSNVKLNLSETL